ncbi:SRPBCC family protein [Phenylobacterium sp. LjRoot225]|uniref:SRPBCC family protein n=1 Tax=Phenylobacterium sp. LjRoot225 TaxID=3342285 RepID=UPI003ECC4800
MRTKISLAAAAAAWVMAAAPVMAEVTDRSPQGFEVVQMATIAAPPAKVWAALVTPALWWDSRHSFSGDAKNLSFDLTAGCFCERLAAGAVRHMTITYADGRSALRMFGGLGPLQFTGAAGALAIQLEPAGAATKVRLSYDVGGYAKGGLAETWAAPVDAVLGAQLARFKRLVETGKAD